MGNLITHQHFRKYNWETLNQRKHKILYGYVKQLSLCLYPEILHFLLHITFSLRSVHVSGNTCSLRSVHVSGNIVCTFNTPLAWVEYVQQYTSTSIISCEV